MWLVIAALLQGSAAAPTNPQDPMKPSVITNPDWQRIPTAQDVSKYYPKAALREDLAGRAILACKVSVEGRLVDCKADRATPDGSGFAEAAVAMSEAFRMRPQTRDGRPVAGGTVRIPLNFIMPANLRAAAVATRHAEVKGEIVELDCRFKDLHLDNCFTRGASTTRASEVALQLAETVTLPPLPTRRRQGRIILPLVFADAAGAATAPEIVTRPRWRDRPTASDVYRSYPEAARKRGLVGAVVVECRIAGDGSLEECVTLSESPAGEHFGEGALKLMPKFKSDAVDSFGLKVEGRKIRVPLRFSPAPPPTRGTG